jgi:hypothetical protein
LRSHSFDVASQFGLVAGHVGAVFFRIDVRQGHRQLGQVLLAGLGLVIVPAVGGLGLRDGGIVLEQRRIVLRGAALVAEQRAHRCQDGGGDGDVAGEFVIRMCRMLDRVVVRAVDVKAVSRHEGWFLSSVLPGCVYR